MSYSVTDKCHIYCRTAELQFKRCMHRYHVAISYIFVSFIIARQSLEGQGILIFEASPSHSDTPHSVGLLWTSDQPDAQNSTWQNTKLKTDINAPGGIFFVK
jgi:hypothetical protein